MDRSVNIYRSSFQNKEAVDILLSYEDEDIDEFSNLH